MGNVSGLNAFTNYSCTVHAVTVSDGPVSNPATVATLEARMIPDYAINYNILQCTYVIVHSLYSSGHQHSHRYQ